jgi:hypothetical protein
LFARAALLGVIYKQKKNTQAPFCKPSFHVCQDFFGCQLFYCLNVSRSREGARYEGGQTPGTDVMILKKYFCEKIANNCVFSQNKATSCKKFIMTLVFLEKCQFFRRKMQKILIITSTPEAGS